MLFYSLKQRKHIKIPKSYIRRISWLRSENDRRYAFTEVLTGEGMMKFVTKKDYELSNALALLI